MENGSIWAYNDEKTGRLRYNFPSASRPMDNYPDLSIQRLLELCLRPAPDQAAWDELISRLEPTVSGVIYKRLARWNKAAREHVEDLIQDTFRKLMERNAKALREFKFINGDEDLFKFVKTVASNVESDYHRKMQREPVDPLDDYIDPPNPQDFRIQAARATLLEQMNNYLKTQAPELECSIFWLHYKQGLSAREIAELAGIHMKEKQVEYTLWKLIRLLRGRFNGSSENLPGGDEGPDV